jgi:YD repeat-containing protein
MKMKFAIPLLLIGSLTIFSCSKDDNSPGGETPGDSLFVKITQGLIPGDDTVFIVSYDDSHRIKSIINSSWEDTLEATYNAAGQLGTITEKDGYGDGNVTTLSYNADHQLTEFNFKGGNYQTRYTFEYTNGVLAKKSFYANDPFDGGTPTLWNYATYEVTNGNITGMKEYSNQDVLLNEITFTYSTEPNVFKPLSLFNAGMNILGADDIANFETFFNKNLLKSKVVTGQQNYTFTYDYTYNDKKQLTKVVVNLPEGAHTRQLSY